MTAKTPYRGLVLLKYGNRAATTRNRFEYYEPYLQEAGITLSYSPLFDNDHLDYALAAKRHPKAKTLRAYWARLKQLWSQSDYDFIWLYSEAFPYLPDIFERWVHRKNLPVIYDYDDAVYAQYDLHPRAITRKFLAGKIAKIQKRATAVVAGSPALLDYARDHSNACHLVPTVVDADYLRPAKARAKTRVCIGWIGSPSTFAQFDRALLDAIQSICAEHDAEFLIVGAHGHGFDAPNIRFERWSEEAELGLLHQMDIGIMPLQDTVWSRGKCAFKLIQYMACGLPVVASPVGANNTVVDAGVNGFLAGDLETWKEALVKLIRDPKMRETFGKSGRQRVLQSYDIKVQAPKMVQILRDAAAQSKIGR